MKYSIFFSLLLISGKLFCQKMETPCLYQSLTDKNAQNYLLDRLGPVYNFKKGETVASIGAGTANREIILSMMTDSLIFYLEDIDSTCVNSVAIRANVNRLYEVAGKRNTAQFIPVIGTEKVVFLPVGSVDKVMIENSLHEFTYQKVVLADIRNSLKPNGILFVQEQMAKKENKKHSGCGKFLFTDQSLIYLLTTNGFTYIKSETTYPNNPAYRSDIKTYVFRK